MSDSGFLARRLLQFTPLITGSCLITLMISGSPSYATPPEYSSFQRE